MIRTGLDPLKPASRIADLTCAEAGTLVKSIPPSRAPWTVIGSVSPPSIAAPILTSGATTRRIGLALSDASPTKVALTPAIPATAPISSRAVVPLLPQSIGASGVRHAAPRTRHRSPSCSTTAPNASTARIVRITSSAMFKLLMMLSPSAIAARVKARCEQLLSPGIAALPDKALPGRAVKAVIRPP